MNKRNVHMPHRRGAVLLIVVGLSAMLLSLATMFLMQMRGITEATRLMIMDAQCRTMQTAAEFYIMETSRLGWGDPSRPSWDSGETFGWTDVRDGGVGPRGERGPDGTIAKPAWWKGLDLGDKDGDPHNANQFTDADLPAAGNRTWPCPGSALRIDAYAMTRPRAAVRLQAHYNLFVPDGNDRRFTDVIVDPTIAAKYGTAPAANWWRDSGYLTPTSGSSAAWDAMHRDHWVPYVKLNYYERYGALDPQPVSDTWNAFVQGDSTPIQASQNLSWFRLYRELPSDKDNDGNPWYDRVPLPGYNTFIVAAGAGGTRGFRFWNASDPGYASDLEPITASASGIFPDEAFFREMQRTQRVLWFRVEWSAMHSGEMEMHRMAGSTAGGFGDRTQAHLSEAETARGDATGDGGATSYWYRTGVSSRNFGTIMWRQRLEKEPPRW